MEIDDAIEIAQRIDVGKKVGQQGKLQSLLDYLVGESEHRWWQSEP